MPKKAQNKESDDNRMNGYIKLFRSAFENDFFNSERFNYFQAFFYLVASANVEDGERIVDNQTNRTVFLKRGQLWTSLRFLARRWNMNERTVISYLNEFEKRSMIHRKSSKSGTVITIVKYGFYNDIFKKSATGKYNSEYNSDYNSEYNSDYNKDKNVIRMYKECTKNEKEETRAREPLFSSAGEELE